MALRSSATHVWASSARHGNLKGRRYKSRHRMDSAAGLGLDRPARRRVTSEEEDPRALRTLGQGQAPTGEAAGVHGYTHLSERSALRRAARRQSLAAGAD